MTSEHTAIVLKSDGPAAPAPPAVAGKTDSSITLNPIAGAEYVMVSTADQWGVVGVWQDSPVFSGLKPNVVYTFYARIKETVTREPSPLSAASAPVRLGNDPPVIIYGDANGDGVVDLRDAVLIAQWLAEWNVTMDYEAARAAGNTGVDIRDAIRIAQWFNRWDVTLGPQGP